MNEKEFYLARSHTLKIINDSCDEIKKLIQFKKIPFNTLQDDLLIIKGNLLNLKDLEKEVINDE